MQSLSIANHPKAGNTTSRLDIIPERISSVLRKKKYAKLANKIYGLQSGQSNRLEKTSEIKGISSSIRMSSESTKVESN